MTTAQPPAPPIEREPIGCPLILIIPDAKVAGKPATLLHLIRRCEAAYHAGVWFVTVPAELAKEVNQ